MFVTFIKPKTPMYSPRKEFDEDLHQEFDSTAKLKTIEYLGNLGINAVENPDRYGVDLIVPDCFYAEVECKYVWTGEEFPYKDVHLPYRKSKYCNLDMPTLFCIWNREFSHLISFNSFIVKEIEPIEVKNKYIPEGELFFKIPIDPDFL